MNAWGLYVSGAVEEEPERFNEPGLFLIAADGTSFYVAAKQHGVRLSKARRRPRRGQLCEHLPDPRRGGTHNHACGRLN